MAYKYLSDKYRTWSMLIPLAWVTLFLTNLPQASSIGCFVCTSINGSEPDCEDTFNNTNRFYRQECFAGRKGRSGLFPGTECIKLKAHHASTGYTVLTRGCTVDDGGVNSETELGRESHCWLVNKVKYQDITMDGCSLACRTDGCNAASGDVIGRRVDVIGLAALSSAIVRQLNN